MDYAVKSSLLDRFSALDDPRQAAKVLYPLPEIILLLGCRRWRLGPEDIMSVGGVRRIEVIERESPVFGGMEFGAVGPYERLHGTVLGELDPRHPLNAGIVNLDRA